MNNLEIILMLIIAFLLLFNLLQLLTVRHIKVELADVNASVAGLAKLVQVGYPENLEELREGILDDVEGLDDNLLLINARLETLDDTIAGVTEKMNNFIIDMDLRETQQRIREHDHA